MLFSSYVLENIFTCYVNRKYYVTILKHIRYDSHYQTKLWLESILRLVVYLTIYNDDFNTPNFRATLRLFAPEKF